MGSSDLHIIRKTVLRKVSDGTVTVPTLPINHPSATIKADAIKADVVLGALGRRQESFRFTIVLATFSAPAYSFH